MCCFHVGNLARHCRQAHAEKNATEIRLTKEKFLCRRRGCNQASFSSRDLYIEHLQQHSGDTRIYSCESCPCVFSSAGNRSKHRKTFHTGNNVTKGEAVQSTTTPVPTAAAAAAAQTPAETEAKYHCSQCQRSFQNHFQLNRHMR